MIPSIVFQALNPGESEKHFMAWAKSIITHNDYEFISIDGKTIRQASKMSNMDGNQGGDPDGNSARRHIMKIPD